MILAGPGIPPARVTTAARLVDLAPTLWDLFGRTPPAPMDGVSLRPAFSPR
jgi:arylsulfatase A-like enzyme